VKLTDASSRSARRTDAFDLPQVKDVVAGIQSTHVLEAFLTALAVQADPGQIVRSQVLP
jgi:hypothetical protein